MKLSDMLKVILPPLIPVFAFILVVILAVWLFGSVISSCSKSVEERGLKGVLEEIWEGKGVTESG